MKLIHRFFAESAIRIRESRAEAIKGKFKSRVLADVSDVCAPGTVANGEIWISRAGRITFSSGVPSSLYQRLRNILVSR